MRDLLKIYNTNVKTNEFEEIKEFRKGSWINLVNPSEMEIKKVCESINIQEDFIRDALDYEEKARIDKEEDITYHNRVQHCIYYGITKGDI